MLNSSECWECREKVRLGVFVICCCLSQTKQPRKAMWETLTSTTKILSQMWKPKTPSLDTAGRSRIHKQHFAPMFQSVRLSIKLGAVSIKLAAAKAIQFNKPINISEWLHVLQGYEKLCKHNQLKQTWKRNYPIRKSHRRKSALIFFMLNCTF